jgi:hypothetical protein
MFDLDDATRYIGCYSKIPDDNEDYRQEKQYKFSIPVPLSFLQKVFDVDPSDSKEDDPYLLDCYIIDEEKAEILQPFFKEKLDLKKYDFMLECVEKKLLERSVRYISVYSKEINEFGGNNLLAMYDFIEIPPLSFLQALFGADPHDTDTEARDVLNYYILNETQAKALQPFIKEKLDIVNYRTALDCDAVDTYKDMQQKLWGREKSGIVYPPCRWAPGHGPEEDED